MDFCVYSKTLAYYLRTKGFQIKRRHLITNNQRKMSTILKTLRN